MPNLSLSDLRDRARRTARGSVPPAGVDPDAPPAAGPDGRRRRAVRRRLRRTRSIRRARVSELGMLAAEMQRRGRWNQDLVDTWVREIDGGEAELRGLEQALRGQVTLDGLIALHVISQCSVCERIGGTGDAFCAGCGRDMATVARTAPAPVEEPQPATGATLAGGLTTIQPPA